MEAGSARSASPTVAARQYESCQSNQRGGSAPRRLRVVLSVLCVSWAILMVLWLAHEVAWRVVIWVHDQRVTPAGPFVRMSVGPLETRRGVGVHCPDLEGPGMTRDEAVAFFLRRQIGYDLHDAAALAADHAPDGVVRSPLFPRVEGTADIEKSYQELFTVFPDWQIRFEDPIIDGARIAQPFTARATHVGELMGLAGTGRRVKIHGALIHHMRDNLIADEQRIYDFTSLLMQLGILKVKATS